MRPGLRVSADFVPCYIRCLHDIYEENGATMNIPASHRWITTADVPEDAETRLKPFQAKAGSILVMDGRLVSKKSPQRVSSIGSDMAVQSGIRAEAM